MEMPPVELMREVSARELARIVGCSPTTIGKELARVPQAHRTDGGYWKCPLYAWYRHQERRGQS